MADSSGTKSSTRSILLADSSGTKSIRRSADALHQMCGESGDLIAEALPRDGWDLFRDLLAGRISSRSFVRTRAVSLVVVFGRRRRGGGIDVNRKRVMGRWLGFGGWENPNPSRSHFKPQRLPFLLLID
ncbi:hypothetical protein ABFS82_12G148400 [Erythranthe guttata]